MLKFLKFHNQEVVVVNNPLNADSRSNSGELAWVHYPNLRESFEHMKKVATEMASNGQTWYGLGDTVLDISLTVDDEEYNGISESAQKRDYETITSYLYATELKNITDNLSGVISKASGKLNAPSKLIVGERPTGIFSMAHASRGLIRLPEYFDSKNNELVPNDSVHSEGEKFFSTDNSSMPPSVFKVEQRQKGTTKMLQINKAAKIKYAGSMMYTDPVTFDGHTLGFATTVKKVYLHKSTDDLKGKGSDRFIDFYIPFNATGGIKKEIMVYMVLPSILLAKAFEGSGFKVGIHKMFQIDKGNNVFMLITTLSNYDDPVNFDAIARGGGDPRIIRYHDLGVTSTYFKRIWDIDTGSGYGRPLKVWQAESCLKEYAYYAAKMADRGKSGYRNANPQLHQIAALTPSNDAAAMKEQAIEVFVKIMDRLGVQFQSASEFASEAIARHMEVFKVDKSTAVSEIIDNIEQPEITQPVNAELRMSDMEFAAAEKEISRAIKNATKDLRLRVK